jgi:hypothetical protein
MMKYRYTTSSAADPDPGSAAFLTPGSTIRIRDGKNLYPGSGINIPDNFSESLGTVFWVKNN